MSLTQHPTQPPAATRRGRERAFVAACVVVTVAAVAGTALLLTGGDSEPTGTTPTSPIAPSSSATPTTPAPATPEDLAAEAARARYADYLRVTDEVAEGGYADPELFRSVAIDPELTQLFLTARRLEGVRSTGSTQVASLEVQSVDLDPAGSFPTVRFLACLDVSQVTAVDAAGESVVVPDRLDRVRSEVVLQDVPPGAFPQEPERSGWYVSELVQPGEPC